MSEGCCAAGKQIQDTSVEAGTDERRMIPQTVFCMVCLAFEAAGGEGRRGGGRRWGCGHRRGIAVSTIASCRLSNVASTSPTKRRRPRIGPLSFRGARRIIKTQQDNIDNVIDR